MKVVALDGEMQPVEVEGTELLARAMMHEIDHLDGRMYTELVEGPLYEVGSEDDEEEIYDDE